MSATGTTTLRHKVQTDGVGQIGGRAWRGMDDGRNVSLVLCWLLILDLQQAGSPGATFDDINPA